MPSIEPTRAEEAPRFTHLPKLPKARKVRKGLFFSEDPQRYTLFFPGFRRLGRLGTFWHALKCGRLGLPQSRQLALYRSVLMKTLPQTWLFPEYSRAKVPPDRCPASSPRGLKRPPDLHIFPSFQRLGRLGKACSSLKTLNDTLYFSPGFRRLGRLGTFRMLSNVEG